MQDAAAAAVAKAEPGLRIPEIVAGPRGPLAGWWETSQGRLHARVISFVPGSTLTGSGYLAPHVVERLGELAAAVSVALAGETHPAAGRVLQWDLQHAERVIAEIAATEPDAEVRDYCAAATAAALAALHPSPPPCRDSSVTSTSPTTTSCARTAWAHSPTPSSTSATSSSRGPWGRSR